ncbi:hypothetical protein M422DRAFT_39427, partial [Sphaerobolus stellatus SS14]
MDLLRFSLIFITPPCSSPSILLTPSTLSDKSKRSTGCADSNSNDRMLMTLSTLLHSTRYYLVFIYSKTI